MIIFIIKRQVQNAHRKDKGCTATRPITQSPSLVPGYEWAGEIRTVEISKEGHQFQFMKFIETGMADLHRRIVKDGYLRELSREEFSRKAPGEIIGDLNYVHPFREGNGRAQLQYLKQLAEQAA